MEQVLMSPQNPRVKADAKLHDRGERRARGECIVEGWAEVTLALDSGAVCRTLYWCRARAKAGEEALAARCARKGIPCQEVGEQAMARLAYREHPDAWLGIFAMPAASLADFWRRSLPGADGAPLYVLAEDLEKPGNIGAILRSADAAGANGFIAAQTRTDLGNPNVVRSSKSAVFALPCAEAANDEALAWLREHHVRIVAATPSATKSYWDADLRGPVALAIGAEKEGLSKFWLDQADEQLLIPMGGRVNSLNAAQAATLLLYEAARQRRSKA